MKYMKKGLNKDEQLIEREDWFIGVSGGGLLSSTGGINSMFGVKESQEVTKAPIFTFCKQMVNALEALSLRSLYGHNKYNKNGEDEDWLNFTRVPNAEEEYSNAGFRHALGIGEDSEEDHLIAAAWNSVAKLEVYLRNKNK